ncbi:hypothetical protein [Neobacillus drentensis]|uniref:hypothetical protein n=1 Tax=Neobacillus drentensis TaxID=220684 RepID=UPI002FFF7852
MVRSYLARYRWVEDFLLNVANVMEKKLQELPIMHGYRNCIGLVYKDSSSQWG